jgi:hypothetical protein
MLMRLSWIPRSMPLSLASVLLPLTLAVVACAPSTSSASGTPAATAPSASTATAKPALTNLTDYCSLVSQAEVSQTTGLTITQMTSIPDTARQVVICGYVASASASTGAVITYTGSPSATQAQTRFAAGKQQAQSRGATVATVSGVGDQAFSTSQNGVDSIVALKGTVVFLVSGTTPHPLPLAVDTSLAQLVASKL